MDDTTTHPLFVALYVGIHHMTDNPEYDHLEVTHATDLDGHTETTIILHRPTPTDASPQP